MSEFQLSCKNSTSGSFNSSWSGWHHYQVIGAAETIILPSLIGVICSTGLVGNILIVFTIVRTQKKTIPDIYICNLAIADLVHIIGMPFLIHQWARGGEWVFGSPLCTIITSLDASNQFTCSAIMTAMSLDSLLKKLPNAKACESTWRRTLYAKKGKIAARDKTVEMETVGNSDVQEEKHEHEEVQNTNKNQEFRRCSFSHIDSCPADTQGCQPFRLTHLRTISKTIRVNLCLWVASLILMFPVWVYSKVIKFEDGLESCAFDLTSPDDVLWYTLYLTITTFFFPLPLIFICYILILCYSWEMYQQNKKAGSYTTSIPRQRVMRLTKMVLALVSVFIVSAAPFHVIQLTNLQVSQPTLTFYVSYYVSICFSYASSSINPFLYILLSGNFQKRLRQCTNVDVRMAERDVNIIENTLKSSF